MATAYITTGQVPPKLCPCCLSQQELDQIVLESMAQKRDKPPANLPQLPVDVYEKLWDMVHNIQQTGVNEAFKLMPLFLCTLSCVCVFPCAMILVCVKCNGVQTRQIMKWREALGTANELTQPYGVTVTLQEKVVGKHGQTAVVGFQLNGAVQMGANMVVVAPAQAQMMGAGEASTDKLRQLQQMKEEGLISEEEYLKKKEDVLKNM